MRWLVLVGCGLSACSFSGTPSQTDEPDASTTPNSDASSATVDAAAPDAPAAVLGPDDVTTVRASCKDYQDDGFSLDGVYPLLGTPADYDAYCLMSEHDGGWTLVLKIDGNNATFRYAAPQGGGVIWTSPQPLNPASSDVTQAEAKLPSFSQVPVDDVLLRFDNGGAALADIVLAAEAQRSSMLALFNNPPAIDTTSGQWRALVDPAQVSLQDNCNEVAVNNENGFFHRNRLGMEFNNENDCDTNDSGVGIGLDTTEHQAPGAGAHNVLNDEVQPFFAFVFVR